MVLRWTKARIDQCVTKLQFQILWFNWSDCTDTRKLWRIPAPVLLRPVLLLLIQWKKERPQFLIYMRVQWVTSALLKMLIQNSLPPPKPMHGLERLSYAMLDFILAQVLEPTSAVVVAISPLLLCLTLGPSVWFLVDAVTRVYYFWIFTQELGYQKKAFFHFCSSWTCNRPADVEYSLSLPKDFRSCEHFYGTVLFKLYLE